MNIFQKGNVLIAGLLIATVASFFGIGQISSQKETVGTLTENIEILHSQMLEQEAEIIDLQNQLDEAENTAKLGAFRPSGYTGKLLTRLTEGGSETTFRTTPNTAPDGTGLSTAKLGDFIVITINPGGDNEEKISVSAVATSSGGVATWTIIDRGLSFTENAAVTANKKQHAIGETVIISDDDHFLSAQYPSRDGNETITGTWTFATFPITASSSFASGTTTGWVELATGGEAASSTLVGDIAASKLALHTGISTSSAPASGNVVVVTGDDGNIDYGFLPDLIGSSTVRYITTLGTTTYTKPAKLKYLDVQVQGAGGGGNGYDTDGTGCCGESGAGGGYSQKRFQASDLPATTTIFVGTGGTGGQSNSTPTSGTAGGESKFYTIVASGGSGGGPGSAYSTGGSATGGDLNISGMGGQNNIGSANTGNQNVTTIGGDSILGKSGMKNSSSGTQGIGYGFGGSGGHDNLGENAYSGGNGIVIIREHF